MKIQLIHKFEDIISVENLLLAWQEFIRGKRAKRDVQIFSLNLMDNIIQLHKELANRSYIHGGYHDFFINDPKPRHIHKASVRDRLLHHAIYRILYPFFDRTFIADSFSCRNKKGTHKALNRLRRFAHEVSKNNTKTCWILKCDIKKFFENIDHGILLPILKSYIPDKNIIWLLERVIGSFSSKPGVGLPLGNLTSQLFVNVYMNVFDQFMKHKTKAEYYLRYADDFVIMSQDRGWLVSLIPEIERFLKERLGLSLHPQKIFLKTLASGMDYLGWVHFPDHRILRTATKRRMMKRILENPTNETLHSYLGLLGHGNTYKLKTTISR